jgi:UDP-N-acetylglucosamine--N-acetylmuramyl-(pentapeptide) pyrophosphoryl-undecaprenol N-acetylglucosamine transferase
MSAKTGTSSMAKRIIMAGGGTGGHIFPAVAIANALKKTDSSVDVLFVGAKGRMEMEKVPQAGYQIQGLDIAGFNRSSLMKNIGLPFKLVKSFMQVRSIFSHFRPDAVVGVGGYSSFPVLRYAQAKGIPSFIHESNSFAGKSNRLLGKKATKVFVASDGMQQFFPAEKIVITGNPVRPDIVNVATINKDEAVRFFNLQPGRKTVLAVGGSLGARSINEAVAKGLNDLTAEGIQVIWQTGKTEAATWKEAATGNSGVWVNEFITQMQQAYAAADIVISRAGAMAIAELCLVKKPVLFVPYPFAAEDHQTVNAQNLVQKGAAMMIKDSEAGERVVPAILELVKDEQKQIELRKNISGLGVTDADRRVAEEILKQLDNS